MTYSNHRVNLLLNQAGDDKILRLVTSGGAGFNVTRQDQVGFNSLNTEAGSVGYDAIVGHQLIDNSNRTDSDDLVFNPLSRTFVSPDELKTDEITDSRTEALRQALAVKIEQASDNHSNRKR